MPKPAKKRATQKPRQKTLLQLLEQKVDVEELLEHIYIDEDKLVDALLDQPNLTLMAGRFRVQRMHVRKMLETKMKLKESQVGQRIRRVRDSSGRNTHTNPAVQERIHLDPDVRRLRRKLNTAESLEEMAKNLIDVFRTRSDSLRTIIAAGKVSVHAKELELLRGNKKLGKLALQLRERWNSQR